MRFLRWLRRIWEWLFPIEKPILDWPLVPYQPLLYLVEWIVAALMVVVGDIASVPVDTGDAVEGLLPVVWVVLMLACPPTALVSAWLISKGQGLQRYVGFWLRLAADVGMGFALTAYTVLRFTMGDYHLIPVGALVASILFIFHLVWRDLKVIVINERLAARLHKGQSDGTRS